MKLGSLFFTLSLILTLGMGNAYAKKKAQVVDPEEAEWAELMSDDFQAEPFLQGCPFKASLKNHVVNWVRFQIKASEDIPALKAMSQDMNQLDLKFYSNYSKNILVKTDGDKADLKRDGAAANVTELDSNEAVLEWRALNYIKFAQQAHAAITQIKTVAATGPAADQDLKVLDSTLTMLENKIKILQAPNDHLERQKAFLALADNYVPEVKKSIELARNEYRRYDRIQRAYIDSEMKVPGSDQEPQVMLADLMTDGSLTEVEVAKLMGFPDGKVPENFLAEKKQKFYKGCPKSYGTMANANTTKIDSSTRSSNKKGGKDKSKSAASSRASNK
jgi:hypothetical protein